MDRFYRRQFNTDGRWAFRVEILESDLFFVADADVENEARKAVLTARSQLESYIAVNPAFRDSLMPVHVEESAPDIVRIMGAAAELYNVGPMASVAGAVAQFCGDIISPRCKHLIIENGGDIYVKSEQPVTLSVYAGEHSPFTGKLRFQVNPAGGSFGVCTSSATVGPSLSFGNTDAVVVVAKTAHLADAAATALGNAVKSPADIEPVISQEAERGLLDALIIVIGDKMGAWGDIKFL